MTKEKNVLKVTERKTFGSAASRRARKEGKVPVVVYGHGATPQSFLIDAKEWNIIAKQDIQIIELQPEKGNPINVLIKDVQIDYLHGIVEHVDFLEVKMDEAIVTMIPIHSTGTPAGLSQGGTLEYITHEVEVNCTPTSIPDSITVDISELELNAAITVGDLELPEGVTPTGDEKQVILHVVEQRASSDDESEEGDAAEENTAPAAE